MWIHKNVINQTGAIFEPEFYNNGDFFLNKFYYIKYCENCNINVNVNFIYYKYNFF